MGDMQNVTGYFYIVYTLTALILGGYTLRLLLAARKAKARIDAASPR
jgi:hypothetical protein